MQQFSIEVSIATQEMRVFADGEQISHYLISTAKNGPGEIFGSECTPRGLHEIRAKIGTNCPVNTVFVRRRPTGEIYSPKLAQQYPGRDWILTRICWLSGLEKEANRLGFNDTMRRYIYIHGTPDSVKMGIPGSRGCIRMRNQDLMALFDTVPVKTTVLIKEK